MKKYYEATLILTNKFEITSEHNGKVESLDQLKGDVLYYNNFENIVTGHVTCICLGIDESIADFRKR